MTRAVNAGPDDGQMTGRHATPHPRPRPALFNPQPAGAPRVAQPLPRPPGRHGTDLTASPRDLMDLRAACLGVASVAAIGCSETGSPQAWPFVCW